MYRGVSYLHGWCCAVCKAVCRQPLCKRCQAIQLLGHTPAAVCNALGSAMLICIWLRAIIASSCHFTFLQITTYHWVAEACPVALHLGQEAQPILSVTVSMMQSLLRCCLHDTTNRQAECRSCDSSLWYTICLSCCHARTTHSWCYGRRAAMQSLPCRSAVTLPLLRHSHQTCPSQPLSDPTKDPLPRP